MTPTTTTTPSPSLVKTSLKGFSKITKPTERNGAYHLQFDFLSLFSADERLETGKVCLVKKFPPFRSERKKRSTSKGTPQFPNGISGKLPYHLTSNRNFWIFWPNGKHPVCVMESVGVGHDSQRVQGARARAHFHLIAEGKTSPHAEGDAELIDLLQQLVTRRVFQEHTD